ncbi:hypothetical protein B7494_g7345 [Chlorociboria aeruginascens]|nr:hypothetical protein B7494_g7345 [Chlorociboria aeruginascens]
MSNSTTKGDESLADLAATVKTATTLISRLQTVSSADPPTPPTTEREEKERPPAIDTNLNLNALSLADASARLIKAHSTKLSLLITNKPFTASAINTVLRELTAEPLQVLAAAVEICNGARYTKAMSEELQWRAKKIFLELGTLIKAVPLNGLVLSDDQKNGTGKANRKGSLALTGMVWEACDAVISLKDLGVAGLLIMKAEQYRDLLKDALEELQEWAEEESDDEQERNGEDDEEMVGVNSTQAAVDNMFAARYHIPSDDQHKIRERLNLSMKRLRLLIEMYQAIIKHRFKTLPPIPHLVRPSERKVKSEEDHDNIQCLDGVLGVMKKIPDMTDELAIAFYELDSKEIDRLMDKCFLTGFAAAELLVKDWEGQKDEFTTWVS